ncbi:MAG: B12-binding domain-containing protein [Actinobacteria bacterium]|nr:B12-binding domain-containing protein [Actinomycetota bacterium]
MDMKERLIKAMGDLDEEGVVSCVEALLSAGADPLLIIELCRAGFEVVGRRYECREYYLCSDATASRCMTWEWTWPRRRLWTRLPAPARAWWPCPACSPWPLMP